MGLRLRLFFLLVVPLVGVVAAFGVVRAVQEARDVVAEERRRATILAHTVRIAVENALTARVMPGGELHRLLADIEGGRQDIWSVRVLDRERAVQGAVTGNGTPPARRLVVNAPVRYAWSGQDRYELRTGALEMVFVAPDVDREVRRAIQGVAARTAALATILAALVALVLQRQVLRPLARLSGALRALGEGRAPGPLAMRRRDEIGVVSRAFDHMATQLAAAREGLEAETEHAFELQQQLRSTERLTLAGKLASGIAHEVGTPLNVISGCAEMVLSQLPADHPARPDLERIIQQIDRVSAIIRAQLDTVRAGKPEIQAVAMSSVVNRLVPLLAHAARRQGVALETGLPDGLPDVAVDSSRVQQVLLNLLMNAVEATPRGGRVRVEARASVHDGRAGVSLEISDTGAGIAPEVLSRIFDPFFTTKAPGQGTGLGLAISRDIVRDHGGTIAVQSRVDQGSTFTVWLPAWEAAA